MKSVRLSKVTFDRPSGRKSRRLAVLLAAPLFLVSCKGLADDAARALNTSKDDVEGIADQIAARTGTSTDEVLEDIVQRGDDVVATQSRARSISLPLAQASDESAARIDELVKDTICDVAEYALENGTLPSADEVAHSLTINALIGQVPEAEVVNAASEFIDAVEDLQGGNYSTASGSLLIYYHRYCGIL